MKIRSGLRGAAVASVVFPGSLAFAGSHTWDVNEIFSSADGTVQFIELKECCGGVNESGVGGHMITSNTNSFTIPNNVEPPTSFKHLLFATQCFADLPGAPTPDHIIVENFFSIDGDTISYTPWDTFSFLDGELPTDGVNSLSSDGTTGPNSPTNYAGETGSVVVPSCPWDLDGDDIVGVTDLIALLGDWGNPYGVNDLIAMLGDWGPCA